MFAGIRIIIGGLFLFSGLTKLISPFQNFLYVVESYKVGTVALQQLVATCIPWFEFFLGLFFMVGLWTKLAGKSLIILLLIFIGASTQAMWRDLPLHDCGCFGGNWRLSPWKMLILDILLLVSVAIMIHATQTKKFSLDNYLTKNIPD